MKLKVKWEFSLGLLVVVVGLGFPRLALAATPPELSVSPFLQEIKIGANDPAKSFSVQFSNDSDQSQELEISVADFGSLDQTGGVLFVGSKFSQLLDKYTLAHWLTLSADSLNLAAHQKALVTATINNDSSLAPGGHYAAIVATLLSQSGGGKNQVSVKQKISSLVLATKTGGERYDLRLEKIQQNGSFVNLPDQVALTFKDPGNTHVVPRGIVYLKDNGGKIIKKGIINEQSGYVLPSSDRVFMVDLKKITLPNFWNRSYKLQVDYRYDGFNKYASKQIKVSVLNPVLIALLAIVLVVALLGWKNKKRLYRIYRNK